MFISDRIAYIELHKTASTHIQSLLQLVEDGKFIGKHNRLPDTFYDRFIIGSIRNPWDWYVSLWAYGCEKKGSVHEQLTRKLNFKYNWKQLPAEMGKSYPTLSEWLIQTWNDVSRPIDKWQALYADKSNPSLFQSWLKEITHTDNRYDIAEGYGFSPISHQYGLMTYRYFKLHTNLQNRLYLEDSLSTLSGLETAWKNHSIINFFIHNESLEEDFLNAMQKAGISITNEQRLEIIAKKNKKENVSQRKYIDYYYDIESIKLVAQKEAFIIKHHNYSYPN